MKVDFKTNAQAATFVAKNFPCCLRLIQGFVGATAVANQQYFIHIFDAYAVPANGTAPLRSLQVIGQDGFSFSYEESELTCQTALCFALSSTDQGYTAVTDGAKATWEGSVDQLEPFTALTVVGDLTTGVGGLQVVTEAAGAAAPKKLVRLEVINGSGNDAWPLVTFTDAFNVNDTTAIRLPKVADGNTGVYNFGKGEFKTYVDGVTLRKGIYIRMSDVATIPYEQPPGTNFNIRAFVSV